MYSDLHAATEVLSARRRELSERLKQLNRVTRRQGKAPAEGSVRRATYSEANQAVDPRDVTIREVARIDNALARISAGRYGCCEFCAGPIEQQRLQAMPDAVFCLSCARKDLENTVY